MWNREDLSSFGGMQTQRQRGGGGWALHLSEEHPGPSLCCCSSLTSEYHRPPLWPWSSVYSGTCSMKEGHLYFQAECSCVPLRSPDVSITPHHTQLRTLCWLLPHCTVCHVCHVLMFSVCLVIPCPLSPSGGRFLTLSSFCHVHILLRRSHPSKLFLLLFKLLYAPTGGHQQSL